MNLSNFIPGMFSRRKKGAHINSGRFFPLRSDKEGEYLFLVGDLGLDLLKEHAGIDLEELRTLVKRVHKKCFDIGFAHGESVHFILDTDDLRSERTVMAVAKIEPPMECDGGTLTRSVFIFGREFIDEMENLEKQILSAIEQAGNLIQPKQKAAMIKATPLAKKTKALMMISHELVHIFATDEYKELMPLLGLDLLELLTDSINFDLHGRDYAAADLIVKSAFSEGFAYLSNLILQEQGLDSQKHLKTMAIRSKEIINKCKSTQAKQVRLSADATS